MSVTELEFFLARHFDSRGRASTAPVLVQAMQYSINTGGKRFRPQVAFLTADLLGVSHDRVMAHAAAIEMIHTYSLIHDDLPCMDNDTYRRNQLTNHMVYGEANALLAGDALLTEAFYILGDHYSALPEIGLELTKILAEAAGMSGMVAGQVVDLEIAKSTNDRDVTLEQIKNMHAQKTGALIRYSAEGVAIIARAPLAQRKQIREFGANLGLAFQIADDILDFSPTKPEKNGLPFRLGLERTREVLETLSRECQHFLQPYGVNGSGLAKIVESNLNRKH